MPRTARILEVEQATSHLLFSYQLPNFLRSGLQRLTSTPIDHDSLGARLPTGSMLGSASGALGSLEGGRKGEARVDLLLHLLLPLCLPQETPPAVLGLPAYHHSLPLSFRPRVPSPPNLCLTPVPHTIFPLLNHPVFLSGL